MKKSFFIFALLAILLIPSQILMFKNYHSLDGRIHTKRIEQFDLALKDGQFPPRLTPTLIDSIGYPLFVVNYQLPYYLAEMVMLPTQNAALAYKTTMALTFIMGTIFAFLMFKETMSLQSAFTGSVIFTYLPYRFGNLYQRGAFGESVSMMFVPLVILAYHRLKKEKQNAIPLLAISIFGLITSHTLMFMIFAPLLILYIPLVLKPTFKQFKSLLAGLILGLTLSSFQIIPSLFEKNYMKFNENLLSLYKDFYLKASNLFIVIIPFNLDTYYQAGFTTSLTTIASLLILMKKIDAKIFFFLSFTVISILLTTSYSSLLWEHLPFIKNILYPYRFLNLTIFSVAFLSAILVEKTKYKNLVAIFLISVTLYTNRHFFIIAPWYSIPPSPNLTTQNENDTIWSNEKTFIQRPLVSTAPQSNIYLSSQKPFDVSANIVNTKPAKVIIRKMYFPGWILKINGKSRPVTIEDGLISTNLEPGNWQIETYFTESRLRMFADILTLASFATLLVLFVKPKLSLKT